MRPADLMAAVNWRRLAAMLGIDLAVLVAATVGVLLLEDQAGVREGTAVYLLAVSLVAFLQGSWPAIGTAIGAFLAYNYLFIAPRFTFVVGERGLLPLGMLLVFGAGIGRLTGLLRDRARESDLREREARSLFAVSSTIAAARRTADALPAVVEGLADEARMRRVWIGLGPTTLQERVLADTDPAGGPPAAGPHLLMHRAEGGRSSWVHLSPPTVAAAQPAAGLLVIRVELRSGAQVIGSLWAIRDRALGEPSAEETRLLAVAADQVGQGLLRDRLMEQATELEVTRRSDALKAALLDSVSHDLKTPLGTIRAAAGTLADDSIAWAPGAREAMARQIDAEAERLARLVGDLLEMSRIEGGALQPQHEVVPIGEIIRPALARAGGLLGHRTVEVDLPDDLPPIDVDPVLANQVIANLLENAASHTAPEAPIRISARREAGMVRFRVEDGGPGVPPDALPRLFDKFYRVPKRRDPARRGSGLGLAVVKGLTEAMGGAVAAVPSDLGGLAIDLFFQVRRGPPE
jgi:two-component system, OmpR family, sensor histidine kinase KdpD